jgi:hypothetical protein
VWQNAGNVNMVSQADENQLTASDDGNGNSALFVSRLEEVHDMALFTSEHTIVSFFVSTYSVVDPLDLYRKQRAVVSPVGNRLFSFGDSDGEAVFIGKGPPTAQASVFPDETLYSYEWSRFPDCKFFVQGPKKTIFASGNPAKPLTIYISEPAGKTSPYRDAPYSTSSTNQNPGSMSTVDILGSNASVITALSTRGDQVVVHTDKGCHLLYAPSADQAETGYRVEQAPATNFSAAVNPQVVGGESGTMSYWLGHDGQIYKDESASRGAEDKKSQADPDQASWKAKGIWEKELHHNLKESFATYDPQSGMYWLYVLSSEYLDDIKDKPPHTVIGVEATPELPGAIDSLAALPEKPGKPLELTGLPELPGAVTDLELITAPGQVKDLEALPEEPGTVTLSALPEKPGTVSDLTGLPERPGTVENLGLITKPGNILTFEAKPELPGQVSTLSSTPEKPGTAQSVSAEPERPGRILTFTAQPERPGQVQSLNTSVDRPGTVTGLSGLPELPGKVQNLTLDVETTKLATPSLTVSVISGQDPTKEAYGDWQNISGASLYHVQASTDSSFSTNGLKIFASATLSYFEFEHDTINHPNEPLYHFSLAPGTTYYIRVMAKGSGSLLDSDWSNVVTHTTTAASVRPGTVTNLTALPEFPGIVTGLSAENPLTCSSNDTHYWRWNGSSLVDLDNNAFDLENTLFYTYVAGFKHAQTPWNGVHESGGPFPNTQALAQSYKGSGSSDTNIFWGSLPSQKPYNGGKSIYWNHNSVGSNGGPIYQMWHAFAPATVDGNGMREWEADFTAQSSAGYWNINRTMKLFRNTATGNMGINMMRGIVIDMSFVKVDNTDACELTGVYHEINGANFMIYVGLRPKSLGSNRMGAYHQDGSLFELHV